MVEDANETPLEYQVFALAFREPGAISYFAEHLSADVVGIVNGNRGLYELYLSLIDFYRKTNLDPVNPIAFRSWLEAETEIYDALGSHEAVSMFIEGFTGIEETTTPDAVCAVLRYRAKKRQQLDNMQELQSLLTQKKTKTDDEVSRINFLTDEIRKLEEDIGYNPLASVVTATQIAEKGEALWELPDFLPTQFMSLNRAMGYTEDGGFCKGAVHAVIAGSGRGKSTFVKTLANHWLDTGSRVLYVNYEEAVAHWERILLTQVTKKNVYMGVNEGEREQYTRIFQSKMIEWGDRLMVRHDMDTPYFEDLERWLRDLNAHGAAPDVVIIDTIQSMFIRGIGARWGQFEEMMVRLEKLAKDMHAVFIITAQENTNRMKEKRELVMQSDTGGSIAIQQKSAITIFITQKKLISGDDSEDEHVMQLQIPKNRITGDAFTLNAPLVRYNDNTKSYEEYEAVNSAPYDAEFLESLLGDDDGFGQW